MILFSLMSAWMWFQIFIASPLPPSNRRSVTGPLFGSTECSISAGCAAQKIVHSYTTCFGHRFGPGPRMAELHRLME